MRRGADIERKKRGKIEKQRRFVLRYRNEKTEKTEQKREEPPPPAFLITATRNAFSHCR
jgi:hypothetical protein